MTSADTSAALDHGSLTAALAASVRATRYDALPPRVRFLARQCLLDWLGVTAAGAQEPLAAILRAEALEEGGRGVATLVGTGERVTARQAALVNGAASHALDYDDVHIGMSGHPSVPVLPALLALAEARGASGREFIAAFVAGFEMECRAGALVMPGHYTTGFHATGTLGTFGAAAACAHLLGLGHEQWLHALGIAGAQAAGLKSMFGTMCKPFHAGKAAANGLHAATLAAHGFSSNTAVFETPQGFAATQTTTTNPARALAGLGESHAIEGVLFKYHAACYGTHETIEALLRLREEHGLAPADVRAVRLVVPPGHLAMCNIPTPVTALEGKFSLRFTAALALGGHGTSDTAFTDAAVRDPALVALRDRVTVEARAATPEAPAIAGGTAVEVTTSDGRTLAETVNLDIPATDLDRQWQRLVAKFRGLAGPILGTQRAERVIETVAALDDLAAIAPLVALCVAPAGVAV